MKPCKDCSALCDTGTRDNPAPQCEDCAHEANLANAVSQFLSLVVDNTERFAMDRASLDNDITVDQLKDMLESLYPA